PGGWGGPLLVGARLESADGPGGRDGARREPAAPRLHPRDGSRADIHRRGALVEKAIEEELLVREALARGLDRNDRSVRNWLVEQMRVLSDDTTDDSDRLYARARVLGLDRTDLVVRRILVQKMRLLAARTGERPPSDADLEALYADHRNEYRPPARVTFWHVFLA